MGFILNMELFFNIFLGVISGVITTALLWVSHTVWKSKITPWLIDVKYRGLLIDGNWKGESLADEEEGADPMRFVFNLSLDQRAHKLSGSMDVSRLIGQNEDASMRFIVAGELWEGYAIVTFSPSSRRTTSYGCAMLKVADGGHQLSGYFTFRNVIDDGVVSLPFTLNNVSMGQGKGH